MNPIQQRFKKGDKVIFIRNGGVLSAKKGRVFTFSNLHGSDGDYWQSVEILSEGNSEHNFSIHDIEKFDSSMHTDFEVTTKGTLKRDYAEFISDYGDPKTE